MISSLGSPPLLVPTAQNPICISLNMHSWSQEGPITERDAKEFWATHTRLSMLLILRPLAVPSSYFCLLFHSLYFTFLYPNPAFLRIRHFFLPPLSFIGFASFINSICLLPDHYTADSFAFLKNHSQKHNWFKIERKQYNRAVCCHPVCLTYMLSTSWEMPGWMSYKLESR